MDGFKRVRGKPKKYSEEILRQEMTQFQLANDMTLYRSQEIMEDPNKRL